MKPPGIEPRRLSDFERELRERAAAWIPAWSIADGERDFGGALLQIAARLSSEVAERLDRVGDKMARGFLDWLAMRGAAARPARLPVAFKLAETAREPVQAPHPVKMQVDAHGATVTFETETDIRLVPGRIDLIVAADPLKDAFFLPPPGLTSLEPLKPMPDRWRLKAFAAAQSTTLQLDPGAGLIEGMLVEIAGAQYRIASAKGDLVTIDPPLPAGDGFDIGGPVTKVTSFLPFEQARSQQDHLLYLGDADLFNIEAQATINVVGASSLGTQATWEYWGKLKSKPSEVEPSWRPLEVKSTTATSLVLAKPSGSVDTREIGTAKARWLRARIPQLDAGQVQPVLTPDEITIEINAPPATPPDVSPVEVIVNTAPTAPNQFFPLGREPRMFDTLYVGSAEAFSKPGAQAEIEFDLAESTLFAMAAIDAGAMGHVLAGVDKTGALHLFKIAPDGTLSALRQPIVPEGKRLSSGRFRPVLWMDGTSLRVAVAAADEVWVWTQAWPFVGASKWDSFKSPPFDTDEQSKVAGLAALSDFNNPSQMLLVAARDKRLSARLPQPNATWISITAEKSPGVPIDIATIVHVPHQTPGQVAGRLIALEGTVTSDLYDVQCTVQSGGQATVASSFTTMAVDVTPAAIERTGNTLELVAVDNGGPRKLQAQRGSTTASVDLEPDHTLADAMLDARLESGQFTAYAVAAAAPNTSGVPDLVAWQPFDPTLRTTLFSTPSDASVGSPQGGLTLHGSFAYAPGARPGEILGAELAGGRNLLSALPGDFGSALALPTPAPALNANDVIATDVGGQPIPAVVDPTQAVNGRGSYANQLFIPLQPWLDRDTNTDHAIRLYPKSSVPGLNGKIGSTNLSQLRLNSTDHTTTQNGDWLLIEYGTTLTVVQISGITGPPAARRGTINIHVTGAPLGASIRYWRQSTSLTGSIFPALKLGGGNNNWSIDALDHGGIYFPHLGPQHQTVIAAAVSSSQPQWLVFENAWGPNKPPISGLSPFVVDDMVRRWLELQGDTSANPTLSWEYWNGTGWWMLDVHDDTGNLRNSGLVTFEIPPDLSQVEWVGKKNYWVRARLTGGDYGQQKVTVVSTTSGNTTTQTIDRSDSGIQPPYALSISVRYWLGEAKPTYLLTQDSGTLRDQSDANRTDGALIEVFTPMIHTLRQFDGAAATNPSDDETCVPDCACQTGTASTSPAHKTPVAAATSPTPTSPSRAERRAIFLGLDSKLIGGPINILLTVQEERLYDRLAPITVEAVIGNRFVPLVASDGTRALGESGLVSMSFAVEPTRTELFGRSLSWLRLTPGDVEVEWKPTLSGAYLNAVWAHAAETMTRERLGGSQGAPGLIVQLARPPLLHDSLELRINEPLGKEERDQLIDADPELVKSDVTDLPGDWVLWKQVADPLDCDANARVYSLDEDTGIIRFGDGQHGAIPPVGPDVIVAFKYERTEPATADGAVPANFVAARTPLNLVTPVETVEAAVAADQAAGGTAPESAERVLHFGAAKLRYRGRVLTAHDIEDFSLEQFADVVQARCFVNGGRVRLVVVMRGVDPMPSHAQQRELSRLLLTAAPSSLAATGALTIEGPRVRRFRIALTLRVPNIDVSGAVASEVQGRLMAYFDTGLGGDRNEGWPIGASPTDADAARALLDVTDLQSIGSIALLEVDPAGEERPWPAVIRKSDLAMLAADGVRIAFDILEAAA